MVTFKMLLPDDQLKDFDGLVRSIHATDYVLARSVLKTL
jgi:hypothetical protein